MKSLWYSRNIIYLLTLALSITLICLSFCSFTNEPVKSLLLGIGCSGIAAALMAFFLDIKDSSVRTQQLKRLRKHYFEKTDIHLKFLLNRIIWLDAHVYDNQFDWGRPIEHYSKQIYLHSQPIETLKNYSDARSKVIACEGKYSSSNMAAMGEAERKIARDMFLIVAQSSTDIVSLSEEMYRERTFLASEGYMSLSEVESIYSSVGQALKIMINGSGDLGGGVKILRSVTDKVNDIMKA